LQKPGGTLFPYAPRILCSCERHMLESYLQEQTRYIYISFVWKKVLIKYTKTYFLSIRLHLALNIFTAPTMHCLYIKYQKLVTYIIYNLNNSILPL